MTETRTPHTKIALVTGASRGLGRALAQSLAADGWQLVINARDPDALREAAAELAGLTDVHPIAGDVADPTHRQALEATVRRLGGVDVVVHNASILGDADEGPPALRPADDYPLDGLRQVLEINTVAPLALTQVLLPLAKPGARIVAITSDAAVEPYEGWAGYGASKAALDQVFAILAAEHPELRVYRVDPGEMRTETYQAAEPDEDISSLPLPEVSVPGLRRLLVGDVPSGRYEARSILTDYPTEEVLA